MAVHTQRKREFFTFEKVVGDCRAAEPHHAGSQWDTGRDNDNDELLDDLIKTHQGTDFVLITDEDGGAGVEAAQETGGSTNVSVGAAQIRIRNMTRPKGVYLD
jgi:hypothetical protein